MTWQPTQPTRDRTNDPDLTLTSSRLGPCNANTASLDQRYATHVENRRELRTIRQSGKGAPGGVFCGCELYAPLAQCLEGPLAAEFAVALLQEAEQTPWVVAKYGKEAGQGREELPVRQDLPTRIADATFGEFQPMAFPLQSDPLLGHPRPCRYAGRVQLSASASSSSFSAVPRVRAALSASRSALLWSEASAEGLPGTSLAPGGRKRPPTSITHDRRREGQGRGGGAEQPEVLRAPQQVAD